MPKHKHVINLLETYVKGSDFKNKAFVFGGYLRDCIVGREPGDIDIILTAPAEEGLRFGVEFAKFAGDYEEGKNPTQINNAIRLCVCKGTPNEMWLDITPYNGDGVHEESVEQLIHSSFYHRDFAVNALYQDLTTGAIIDPAGISMKAFVERSLNTVTNDYDSLFWCFPSRLYRMFRIQAQTGFSIPTAQIEYARDHWWLGNFIERERIITEVARLREGKYASLALSNLKYAKLDPSDLTRADVFLGTGWCECEPGQEPARVKKEPHARWTSKNPVIYLNPSVEAVEIEFTKSGYCDFNAIQFSRGDGPLEEQVLDGNSVRIPTAGVKQMTLEIPSFVPSKVTDTTDSRELGIYVTKINTYKMGEKTETLIDCVPNYIAV